MGVAGGRRSSVERRAMGATGASCSEAAAENAAENGYGGSSSSCCEHPEKRPCSEGETASDGDSALALAVKLSGFFRRFSNSANWYIMLMLGEMTLDFCFTKSYASVNPTFRDRITHAITKLADRETPSWQCTKALPLPLWLATASSMRANAAGKS